jgi:hypothetical protein
MGNEPDAGSAEIAVEELRRAVLYLADAVLQLSRAADQMASQLQFTRLPNDPFFGMNMAQFGNAARRAEERLRKAVDLLVKPDAPDATRSGYSTMWRSELPEVWGSPFVTKI